MKQILCLFLIAFFTLSNAEPPTTAESTPESELKSESRQILVLLRQAPAHYRGGDGYGSGYGDERSKASREVIGKRLAKEHGMRFVGFWAMPEIKLDCIIMEAAEGQVVRDVIAEIEKNKEVQWAEAVEEYQSLGEAEYNDPLFAAAPVAILWHLAELHKIATGKGVSIGVVDSSIDVTHPDLSGQMALNRNFVEGRSFGPESHGTGVAGVIAAKPNNNKGMVGVAPKARLVGLRACWQNVSGSVCDSLSLAKALHFAIEKDVDVLNLSLTGPKSKLLTELIAKATSNGVVVVAAVDRNVANGGFPASSSGVVAVSEGASAASNSNAFRAPGKGIPTTQPGSKWSMVNGSSYSAAHVSGLFALLIEERGNGKARPTLIREKNGGGSIDTRASLKKASGG